MDLPEAIRQARATKHGSAAFQSDSTSPTSSTSSSTARASTPQPTRGSFTCSTTRTVLAMNRAFAESCVRETSLPLVLQRAPARRLGPAACSSAGVARDVHRRLACGQHRCSPPGHPDRGRAAGGSVACIHDAPLNPSRLECHRCSPSHATRRGPYGMRRGARRRRGEPDLAPATVSSAWLGRAAPTRATPRSNRAAQAEAVAAVTDGVTDEQAAALPIPAIMRWGRATCSKPAWVSASWSWVAAGAVGGYAPCRWRALGAHTSYRDGSRRHRRGTPARRRRDLRSAAAARNAAPRRTPRQGHHPVVGAHCAYRNSRALTRQSRSAGDVNRPRLDRSARPKAVGDLGDTVHAPNQHRAASPVERRARDFDFRSPRPSKTAR